jgi:hypothetical protein
MSGHQSALGVKADSICSPRAFQVMTDAVEKVGGMPRSHNNRIMDSDSVNRSCAFDARLESILLALISCLGAICAPVPESYKVSMQLSVIAITHAVDGCGISRLIRVGRVA